MTRSAAPGRAERARAEDNRLIAKLDAAESRLRGVAVETPVLRSRQLDLQCGVRVSLKAEMYQRTGSFKFRGAYNRIAIAGEAAAGIVAHSSGNFAQAVALASALQGRSAVVVMPEDAPKIKVDAVRGYGAEIVFCGRRSSERAEIAQHLSIQRNLALIEPYDDEDVIAGQGTATRELLRSVPELDTLVVPLGGGGLLSGAAVAVRADAPGIRVIGVEPARMPKYERSLAVNELVTVPTRRTVMDGQMINTPGKVTFPIIQRLVDEVITVRDRDVLAAMSFLYERLKVVAEPSGASALAAVLAGAVPEAKNVGVMLSGGNVGLSQMVELFRPPCR